jgi:hypothetical protein
LKTFFSKSEAIKHIVEKDDALNILQEGWTTHKVPFDILPKSIKNSVLRISKFGETHIPLVIRETINLWVTEHPAIVNLLKKQVRTEQEEETIKSEFKLWETDLERKVCQREATLTLLGIGTTAALAGTSIDLIKAAAGSVMKIVGIGSSLLSFPIPAFLFLGAAFTFAGEKKKELHEGTRKEFETYSKGFLSAQAYWNNKDLTPTEKDLICYELDKSLCLQLGTARKELDAHFMDADKRLKQLGEEIEKNLTPAVIAQINDALAPIQYWLQDLEWRVGGLERNVQVLSDRIEEMMKTHLAEYHGIYWRPEDLGLTSSDKGWIVSTEITGDYEVEFVMGGEEGSGKLTSFI